MDLKKDSWSQQDILDIITNDTEESIYLDFKSSGSIDMSNNKKSEISKDVSAFANSDGGIIIYGILEDRHLAKEISFIDGNVYSKEWLEQIIQSNIQRKLTDIKIFPIRFDNDILKSIYVVNIPISTNGPHMCKDKRYYRRYNFESVIMEEYEIRNFYLRRQISKVVYYGVTALSIDTNDWKDQNKYKFRIDVQVKNNGEVFSDSYRVSCFFQKPKEININYNVDKSYVLTHLNGNNMSISSIKRIPIFPNELLTIVDFYLEIEFSEWPKVTSPIMLKIKVYNEGWIDEDEVNIYNLINNLRESWVNDENVATT